MTFGENLRKLRKGKGYTQVEFARIVGLSQAAITAYERDVREPSFDVCKQIAGALGVPVSSVYPLGTADDDIVQKVSDSLHQNPKIGLLFDRVQLLKPSDIDAVLNIVNAIVKERNT